MSLLPPAPRPPEDALDDVDYAEPTESRCRRCTCGAAYFLAAIFAASLIYGLGWIAGSFRSAAATARTHRLEQVISGERPPAWLGAQVRDFGPELAAETDLPMLRGALVSRVLSDSPALALGLRMGDLITAVDGRRVRSAGDLHVALALTDPASRVQIRIVRGGQVITLAGRVGGLSNGQTWSIHSAS